jgi:hypothetical protein
MIKIKLTTSNPDFPLIRQTPNSEGIWGNCKFYINTDIEECDYWVIYDSLNNIERTKCPKENIILFTGEPPSVKKYSKCFTNQFSTIISCQKDIIHKNVIYKQQALPWMAGAKYLKEKNKWDSNRYLSYNDFLKLNSQKKDKEVSIIISNKAFTEGHEQRIKFLDALKKAFGNRIELFGRGYNEIEDKFEALTNFKYSIVMENSSFQDYWTEKLSDTFLCNTYPIYYGCPNILDYFSEDSLNIINIYKINDSINIIKSVIESNKYEKSLESLEKAKNLVLNQYNLFSTITNLINGFEKRKGLDKKNEQIKIYPEKRYRRLFRKIVSNFSLI